MAGVLFDRGAQIQQKKISGSSGFVFSGYHFVPEDRYQRQPIQLSDSQSFLYCGRLDNRAHLISELGLESTSASNIADSGIAASAWAKWGVSGLVRWIGPHASACWDPRRKELTLMRGAPHGRAIMYFRKHDSLYFSTVLDSLFSLPFIPREINEDVLADILLGGAAGTKFLYKGIGAVANSHWAVFGPGNLSRSQRYWSLEPRRRLRFASERECWEAFSELFREVVSSHLRASGPVGIRLSGGLDSSAVAAQAAVILAERGQELHTYTRIPQSGAVLPKIGTLRYADESEKVRQLAQQYPNMRVNLVPPDTRGVMDGMEEWYSANYSPALSTPSFISGYRPMLQKASEDKVRLLLNAAHGNVTFSHAGFGRLRELFRSGRWLALRRELKKLERHGYNVKALMLQEAIKPLIPMPIYKLRQRLRKNKAESWSWFSAIDPKFASETGAVDRFIENENFRLYFNKWTTWQRRAAFIDGTGQVSQGGGGEVLYGFDQRDPTGDRRLVEFCMALPEKYFLAGGIDRRLARLGLKHLLPESIRMDFRLGLQDIDWAHRVRQDEDAISEAYEKFRKDPDLSRYLDFERLDELMSEFKASDISQISRRRAIQFQLAMLGPLHAGNFVRWFHGRND